MDRHDPAWDDPQLLRKKRILGTLSIVGVLLIFALITYLLCVPLLNAIRDKASFRQWMQGTGFWKYPLMAGIMALQVIIAFIPGEPIEILAGYIFGAWGGLLLCLLGAALGSVIIILAVRKLGMKFVTLFVERGQIENLKFLSDPKKRDAAIFMMFLIPGTPKDILTYLTGLVPIHLGKYLLITSVARIPSILTSTMGGNMLGKQEYKVAILVFAVTLALTLAVMLLYRGYQKRREQAEQRAEAEKEATDPAVPETGAEAAPDLQETNGRLEEALPPLTDLAPLPDHGDMDAEQDTAPLPPMALPAEADGVVAEKPDTPLPSLEAMVDGAAREGREASGKTDPEHETAQTAAKGAGDVPAE